MITVDKRKTRHCLGCRVHIHHDATVIPAVHLVRDDETIIGDVRPIKKRWGYRLEQVSIAYSAWLQLPNGFLRFLGNSHASIEEARMAIERERVAA